MDILAILYIVVAVSEDALPPLWLWVIIAILFVFSMILLTLSTTTVNVPKSKLNN